MKNLKFLVFILACFSLNCLFSQDEDVYHTSWNTDGYIIGGSAALLIGEYFITNDAKILTVEEINSINREDVFSFDRSAIENYNLSAADASDLFRDGITIAPLALLLSSKVRGEAGNIGVMFLESVLINSAVTSNVKSISTRK